MNKLKITEIFAFIAKDDEGNEGLMGCKVLSDEGREEWFPMIGADIERVESIKHIADEIKEITGRDYEIRYFISKF